MRWLRRSALPGSLRKERHAFGRPIGATRHRLRLCRPRRLYESSRRSPTRRPGVDTGRPYKQPAAIAKLQSTEAAVDRTRIGDPGVRRLRRSWTGRSLPASTATPRSSRSGRAREIQRLVIPGPRPPLRSIARQAHRRAQAPDMVAAGAGREHRGGDRLLAAGAALTWTWQRVRDIPRIELGDQLTAIDTAVAEGGVAQNVLIVGTDSADGLPDDDPVRVGRDNGVRSDTIMLLRIDPESEHADLLSLPRDLYVPIAGTGGSAGSTPPSRAVPPGWSRPSPTPSTSRCTTTWRWTSPGFRELVEAVDGVPIYFPEPVRDRHSGLDVPEPGCITLDPVQALAFARSRAYEVRATGAGWSTAPATSAGSPVSSTSSARPSIEPSSGEPATRPSSPTWWSRASGLDARLDHHPVRPQRHRGPLPVVRSRRPRDPCPAGQRRRRRRRRRAAARHDRGPTDPRHLPGGRPERGRGRQHGGGHPQRHGDGGPGRGGRRRPRANSASWSRPTTPATPAAPTSPSPWSGTPRVTRPGPAC